jgi:cation diffusion facilitator CzcD-associated flavoprotein CzcO
LLQAALNGDCEHHAVPRTPEELAAEAREAAFHNGLPGMPLPAPRSYFPTKDEMADYLEAYASKFDLPVRFGRQVDSLSRYDDAYLVSAGYERYVSEHVVVATGPLPTSENPRFRRETRPGDLPATLQRLPKPRPAARG